MLNKQLVPEMTGVRLKDKYVFKRTNIKTTGRFSIFMDRDGVLIKDKHYLASASQVELHEGVIELFKSLAERSITAVVITNQSGIGRGLFDWKEYEQVTAEMMKQLNYPSCLLGIYANGYLPGKEEEADHWRKPGPGMLIQAAEDFGINLNTSQIVGDRLSDIVAGARAGIMTAYHVKTGHGETEREQVRNMSKGKWLNAYDCETPCIKLLGSVSELLHYIKD